MWHLSIHIYGTMYVYQLIDLNWFRCHIEFNMDENEAVKDKLTVLTMAHTV